MSRIIVGVDGSASAEAAFRWAYDHAKADDTVVALHSWQIFPVVGLEAPIYNPSDFEVAARRFMREFVEAFETRTDGPTIETQVVHGSAAPELVEESANSDLMVLGSRGLGGFRGALLGSVSGFVVHHSKCPVVVMPSCDTAS